MKQILFSLFSFVVTVCHTQSNSNLKLWYNTPSGSTWENALPIGNGRLGAMIYGNADTETVQLNEHTVWSGSPNRNDNPLCFDSLTEIRKLIFEGRQKEAGALANKTIVSQTSQGQMFEPVGSLRLVFDKHDNYTGYYRELDIEKAVQKTSYTIDDITYTREVLASFPDHVIVMHLTASKPGSISFNAFFSTLQPKAVMKTIPAKELAISGTTVDHEGVEGKIRFKGIARFKLDGGNILSNDTALTIKNANEVTIYISIATNFNNYNDISGDENERATSYLDKAYPKSFTDILKAHVAAYQKYFNRVRLDLGTTDAAKLPADERLKNFNSTNDPQFVTLYFQYGRYLLISSSQPGGQPATLQGIWNNKLFPPWDSKYTININTEMNYWPAEKTNLAEMDEPLIKMVNELAETGQQTAKEMYHARGWMAHHNTDLWRGTAPINNIDGVWPTGGAWLCYHLWEHYLFTRDTNFLARAYPAMKGASQFFMDYLIKDPKTGFLVTSPSFSPE